MHTPFKLAALAAAVAFTYGCEQPSSPLVSEKQAAEKPGLQAAENGVKSAPQTTDPRTQTLVSVDGFPITGEMFGLYYSQRLKKMPGAKNSPEAQNQSINEMINMVLLTREAEKAGLQNNPNVRVALELQRSELLSRIALQQHASQNLPSDEALKAAYDAKYANESAGSEYKARHILVAEEDKAKELIIEINGGADFAEMAKEHSTGPSGKNGGDLGWFEGSQMVKPFSDALKTMEPGSVSAEPVKTQFGWHIILLEETRAKEPPTFESVRPQLQANASRQVLQDYVHKLRESSKIVLNEELTKKKPAPEMAPMPAPAAAE